MKKTIILISTLVIILLITNTSYATFTTGTGKHTFKLEVFRPTPELTLQSFLVGLGINQKSSINLRLTNPNEEKYPLNFLAPYYLHMHGSENKKENSSHKNNFYATGPILEVMLQYIPKHTLFVNPNSLNALQFGIRNLRGDSKLDYENDNIVADEHVNRTYLMMGILSRSRLDNYNVYSNLNFTTDIAHRSWGMDAEIGLEYKFKNNFRNQFGYRYIATSSGSASGITLSLKIDY